MAEPNIVGYTGYWGSGKSLMMAREALRRIKRDPHLIVGNNFGFVHPLALEINSVDDLIDFAVLPTPGYRKLILIDEIRMLFPPGAGLTAWPGACDVLFTQGRKLGVSMLWTAQHWRFANVNVRRVTDRAVVVDSFWPKRISPRGELPKRERGRLYRCKVYNSPDPEVGQLPRECDHVSWHVFPQRAADSYDTMKLVESAALVVRQQLDQARRSPVVEVLADLTGQG